MTDNGASGPRACLAAVLVLVLLLAGVGRGWAAASVDVDVVSSIPGVTVHICHGDGDDASSQGGSGQHDCCDVCALCAPATLGGQPDLTAPSRVVQYCTHTAALPWMPVLARPWTPRLAQGPPAA